jgi:hypothetical protein
MPTYPFPSAPTWGSRVPFQFISTDVPSLSISIANSNTLTNNPEVFLVSSGTTVASNPGVDGINYIRGTIEYAPFALELDWKIIGYNDYLSLSKLQPYYIHLISHRLIGYYGRLSLEGPKTAGPKSADVLTLKGMFYPQAPSDQGGAATVNRLSTPTTFAASSGTANSGYIPASQPTYYWLTFATIYGQTTPQMIGPISTSAANVANTLTWSWPSSTVKCIAAYIYSATTSTSSTALQLAAVPYGLTPAWIDYVGAGGAVVTIPPPTTNTACRGDWYGGIWQNEP